MVLIRLKNYSFFSIETVFLILQHKLKCFSMIQLCMITDCSNTVLRDLKPYCIPYNLSFWGLIVEICVQKLI